MEQAEEQNWQIQRSAHLPERREENSHLFSYEANHFEHHCFPWFTWRHADEGRDSLLLGSGLNWWYKGEKANPFLRSLHDKGNRSKTDKTMIQFVWKPRPCESQCSAEPDCATGRPAIVREADLVTIVLPCCSPLPLYGPNLAQEKACSLSQAMGHLALRPKVEKDQGKFDPTFRLKFFSS